MSSRPAQRSGGDVIVFHSHARAATVAAGKALGQILRAGDTVALDGDLGAGKTTFTAGIADGIGCLVPVSSPTFVLAMEHPAGADGLSMRHLDLYRLEGVDDYLETGLDEPSGLDVEVIEWAEVADAALPADRIRITIHTTGENSREFAVRFASADGRARAAQLTRLLRAVPHIQLAKE